MTLYLVRWPTFSLSIIRADDEDDLVDQLDQVGDPGGCTWEAYDGPLWIDFALPEPIGIVAEKGTEAGRAAVKLEGVEALAGHPDPELVPTLPDPCDVRDEMKEELRARGFPHLHRLACRAASRKDPEAPLRVSTLEKALHLELEGWHARQALHRELEQRTDFEAKLLRLLGLTVATPEVKEAIAHAREALEQMDEEERERLLKDYHEVLQATGAVGASSGFAEGKRRKKPRR